MLARAAIVGRDFGVQAVRELLPPQARGPLSRNLQTLVAKGLVQHQPSARRPGEEYSFRHILIQEAAYRAVPKSLRAELHQRFADWLEYVRWDPATTRPEILGYHLEQSVRYLSELHPAEAQSSPLPRRAADHLEAAGVAADDRDDALAAVNLLVRAAALLPGDDPALARLYTSLGAALTEAGQLEKAKATLDDAQRIAASSGDEGQRAHARAQALLSGLKQVPNMAAVQVAQALPELRAEFARDPDERGLCLALRLEAAVYWIHGRAAAADDAWRRAAEYARRANDRKQLTEILGWLASAALWGPTPGRGGNTTLRGLFRRGREPPARAGCDPQPPGGLAGHAGSGRGGAGHAALGQVLPGPPRPDDDGGGHPARGVRRDARGRPGNGGDVPAFRLRHAQPDGRERQPVHGGGTAGQGHRGAGQTRYGEARELVALGRQTAAGEDLVTEIIGQGLSARMLADDGRHAEAAELASAAVALAAQTDLLSQHADALLDLAHVLGAAGLFSEARVSVSQALDLYQIKGNLPGAREAQGYLTRYAHTSERGLLDVE